MIFSNKKAQQQKAHDPIEEDLDFKTVQGGFGALWSLVQYARGEFRPLLGSIALILAGTAVLMLSAKMFGTLVARLSERLTWEGNLTLISSILALELAHVALVHVGRLRLAKTTNDVALHIRWQMFRKLSRLPIAYFDKQPLGRTLTRMTSDVEGVEKFFATTLPHLIHAFLILFSILAAMLLTDIRAGWVITMVTLPIIAFTILTRIPIRNRLRIHKARAAQINSKLAEFINGIEVIKAFDLEKLSQRQYDQAATNLWRASLAHMNLNSFVRPTSALLSSLPMLMVLWWGGHEVLAGQLSIALFVTFVRYGERFFKPIMQISNEIHILQDALSSCERIQHMLAEQEEDSVFGSDQHETAEIKGDVRYQDVWMAYDDGDQVLKGVSFEARRGMKIGLVGATGSGKSTTLNLLPLLYPHSRGSIEIDGKPIERWGRREIRRQLGVVSQDVVLFHGTVRDNLLMTMPDRASISDQELWHAAAKTGLATVLHRMPQGLDTVIFDGGVNLSVGERQLLSVTRTLLRNPSIVILDEATANIDEQNEAQIQSAMDELLKDRTCFVIAHRLKTIRTCDRILVFKDGRIVEQGTHQSLMDQHGYYAQMTEIQEQGETRH